MFVANRSRCSLHHCLQNTFSRITGKVSSSRCTPIPNAITDSRLYDGILLYGISVESSVPNVVTTSLAIWALGAAERDQAKIRLPMATPEHDTRTAHESSCIPLGLPSDDVSICDFGRRTTFCMGIDLSCSHSRRRRVAVMLKVSHVNVFTIISSYRMFHSLHWHRCLATPSFS